jgi:nitrite reductase/ring-hydroxylating ferredoxin subunit
VSDAAPLCGTDEIADGQARGFTVGRVELVVVRHGERFYALQGVCPHRGAALCDGVVGGTALPSEVGVIRYGRDGEILRCPWHGWEYDITDGRSLHDPARQRVRAYPVEVRDGQVFVNLAGRVESRPA